MNVYLIKNILIERYKEAASLYYMLNSLCLRQTLFVENPMNARTSFKFYKTVFRSILFLALQQVCEVDIMIFPMEEMRKLVQNTEFAQDDLANK